MEGCIAITSAGWGDVWLLESRPEADAHPLIQYGDVIIEGPDDIAESYSLIELPALLAKLDDERLTERVTSEMRQVKRQSRRARVNTLKTLAPALLERLCQMASPVLQDPSEICETVRRDRTHLEKVRRSMSKNAGATETKDAGKAAENKAEKKPAFADDAKITMSKDKDGNVYGPDNNPKREGSNAHAAFAKLKDGMTVKQYVDALGNQAKAFAELKYNTVKGFCTVG